MTTTARRGFTLVEVLIVIVVSIILAGVVMPSVHSMDDQRIGAALRILDADIGFCRARAIATGVSHRILFDIPRQSYVVEAPPGVLLNEPLKKRPWARTLSKDPIADTLLKSVNFGGQRAVTFDAAGMPSSGGSVVLGAGTFQGTLDLVPITGDVVLTLP